MQTKSLLEFTAVQAGTCFRDVRRKDFNPTSLGMSTPYEALNKDGFTYVREARTIHELPTPAERLTALAAATNAVAKVLGVPAPVRPISLGEPVFRSFGFNSTRQVQGHPHKKLLTTVGQDLPIRLA